MNILDKHKFNVKILNISTKKPLKNIIPWILDLINFKCVIELICINNNIKGFVNLPDTLLKLNCRNNPLSIISILPKNLLILNYATYDTYNYNGYNKIILIFINLQELQFKHCNKLSQNIIDNKSIRLDVNTINKKYNYYHKIDYLNNIYHDKKILPKNILYDLKTIKCSNISLRGIDNFVVYNTYLNKIIIIVNNYDYIININCSYNNIANLSILPKNLRILNCSYNNIKYLNNLPNSLRILNCSNNKINCLNCLPDCLEILYCHKNANLLLNNLPNSLLSLICSENKFEQLNYLPNSLIMLVVKSIKLNNSLPNSLLIIKLLMTHENDKLLMTHENDRLLANYFNTFQCTRNKRYLIYSKLSNSSLI